MGIACRGISVEPAHFLYRASTEKRRCGTRRGRLACGVRRTETAAGRIFGLLPLAHCGDLDFDSADLGIPAESAAKPQAIRCAADVVHPATGFAAYCVAPSGCEGRACCQETHCTDSVAWHERNRRVSSAADDLVDSGAGD